MSSPSSPSITSLADLQFYEDSPVLFDSDDYTVGTLYLSERLLYVAGEAEKFSLHALREEDAPLSSSKGTCCGLQP